MTGAPVNSLICGDIKNFFRGFLSLPCHYQDPGMGGGPQPMQFFHSGQQGRPLPDVKMCSNDSSVYIEMLMLKGTYEDLSPGAGPHAAAYRENFIVAVV